MRTSIQTYMRGSVKIGLYGNEPEQMVNAMTAQQMEVWDVARKADGSMQLTLHLADFFRMRPLLRQTGCRFRIKGKKGFPFALAQMERRKWFFGGMAVFLVAIYVLSSVVWRIEVVGNEKVHRDSILEAAAEEGLYLRQWKFRLDEPGAIADRITRRLPEAAWIGLEIEGTKARIQIVEGVRPEERPLMNPRHLISMHDAVITRIIAETGKPQVSVHTRVRQGQVLISGLIGAADQPQLVVAKGEVFGLVWYEYTARVPLEQQSEGLSGEGYRRSYLRIGDMAIQISGYRPPEYAKSRVDRNERMFKLGSYRLPIGWISDEVSEVLEQGMTLDDEAALERALEQASSDIRVRAGHTAEIRSYQVLSNRRVEGVLEVRMLYEVEQEIAGELPLVSTQDQEQPSQ